MYNCIRHPRHCRRPTPQVLLQVLQSPCCQVHLMWNFWLHLHLSTWWFHTKESVEICRRYLNFFIKQSHWHAGFASFVNLGSSLGWFLLKRREESAFVVSSRPPWKRFQKTSNLPKESGSKACACIYTVHMRNLRLQWGMHNRRIQAPLHQVCCEKHMAGLICPAFRTCPAWIVEDLPRWPVLYIYINSSIWNKCAWMRENPILKHHFIKQLEVWCYIKKHHKTDCWLYKCVTYVFRSMRLATILTVQPRLGCRALKWHSNFVPPRRSWTSCKFTPEKWWIGRWSSPFGMVTFQDIC